MPCAKIEFLQTEFGPEIAQGGAGRSTADYACIFYLWMQMHGKFDRKRR